MHASVEAIIFWWSVLRKANPF